MTRTVTKIEFLSSQAAGEMVGYSEQLRIFEIGNCDVVQIEESQPRKSGDEWSYLVVFGNGEAQRIFSPKRVYLSVELKPNYGKI